MMNTMSRMRQLPSKNYSTIVDCLFSLIVSFIHINSLIHSIAFLLKNEKRLGTNSEIKWSWRSWYQWQGFRHANTGDFRSVVEFREKQNKYSAATLWYPNTSPLQYNIKINPQNRWTFESNKGIMETYPNWIFGLKKQTTKSLDALSRFSQSKSVLKYSYFQTTLAL